MLVLLTGCAASFAVPASLDNDPFYTKQTSVSGIPILSSSRVEDRTLVASREMIEGMLAHRPELGAWLAVNDYRVSVMAEEEAITDLPENAHWKKPTPDDERLTRCERKHYEERIGRLSDRE